MNTQINDRIELIIKELGLTKNSFSIKMGYTNGTAIGNIVSGRRNFPSYDMIFKIISTFDKINAEWLITGKGEMFIKAPPKEYKNDIPLKAVEESKAYFESKIDNDKQIIEMQRGRIEALMMAIEAKDQLIKELRHQIPNGNGARSAS